MLGSAKWPPPNNWRIGKTGWENTIPLLIATRHSQMISLSCHWNTAVTWNDWRLESPSLPDHSWHRFPCQWKELNRSKGRRVKVCSMGIYVNQTMISLQIYISKLNVNGGSVKRIEKSLHIACFDSIFRTCRLEARCILWVATDWLEGRRPRKRVKNKQNSAASLKMVTKTCINTLSLQQRILWSHNGRPIVFLPWI